MVHLKFYIFSLSKIRFRYLIYLLSCFIFCLQIELYAQKLPKWIIEPEAYYSSTQYLFGVGEGNTMEIAKNQAFAHLSRVFGTKVKQNVSSKENLYEINGEMSKEVSLKDNITMDSEHNLLNVKIEKTYQDKKSNMFYALAVMNKKETVDILSNMINKNMKDISIHVEAYLIEYDLLKKYSLLMHALNVSEKNDIYIVQILYLDKNKTNISSIPDKYTSQYISSEILNITRKISFDVITSSNELSSISSSIKKVLKDLKININSKNPSYFFDVYLETDSSYVYGKYLINYVLYINIIDFKTDEEIKSFTFSGKSLASNEKEAIKRSIREINKNIRENFQDDVLKYFDNI